MEKTIGGNIMPNLAHPKIITSAFAKRESNYH